MDTASVMAGYIGTETVPPERRNELGSGLSRLYGLGYWTRRFIVLQHMAAAYCIAIHAGGHIAKAKSNRSAYRCAVYYLAQAGAVFPLN